MVVLHHPPHICLGCDVAKDTIAVSCGGPATVIANRSRDIRRFLRNCEADLVICEPTGGYETVLIEECLRRGLAVHRADTRRLKAFMYAKLYYHPEQTETAAKADAVIAQLWHAYCEDPARMGPGWVDRLPQDEPHRSRHIADYIAGMSDRFALESLREIKGSAPDDLSNV